jgi:hypothetical protein
MRRAMQRKLTRAMALAAALALPVAAAAELLPGDRDATFYTWDALFSLAKGIIELIIQIATIAAAIFLMYGGWLYLTSGGDSAKVARAHDTLKNAGVGLGILVAAWLIVTGIISALGGESWLTQFFGIRGGPSGVDYNSRNSWGSNAV